MDALPYIDNDLDLPGMREAVDHCCRTFVALPSPCTVQVMDLIEQEKATLPFDEDKYLGHLKDVFFTAFQVWY